MASTQAAMAIFIILLSIKLVQDVVKREMSMWFIIQSYLGTSLMFAGFYALINKMDVHAFTGIPASNQFSSVPAMLNFVDFFTFSIGIMSAGISKIYPEMWYAEIVVTIQMLTCMLYWCVILGSGLDHVLSLTPVKPEPKRADGSVKTLGAVNSMSNLSDASRGSKYFVATRPPSRRTSRNVPNVRETADGGDT